MPRYESHWKDFNSPLTRNEAWVNCCYLWPKLFWLPFVRMGIVSRKNTIEYFVDMEAGGRLQKVLADRIQENPRVLREFVEKANRWGEEMNRYTASVARRDLSRVSVQTLRALYKKFLALQSREYAIGILLVVLDISFGPWSFDRIAKDILKKYLRGSALDRTYAILTTPTRESFARQQERELLSVYTRWLSSPRGSAVLHALERHAKKWAWTYYVYAGPEWTEQQFLETMQDWAQKKVKAKTLLAQWEKERRATHHEQKDLLRRLPCTKNEREFLSLLSLVVWAKPRRKDYQSKSYWHMERLLREVGRRLEIALADVRSLPQPLLWKALETGKVNRKQIRSLYDFHVVFPGSRQALLLSGTKAQKIIATIKRKVVQVHGTIFHGSPACPGKVKGVVRIVNAPSDIGKMRDGEVLVSVATTPSIISALRKASAILTDEGGLTCHAAIVSRELKIPCIVGLQYITQALKDGDRVEVDATKGIVRKI